MPDASVSLHFDGRWLSIQTSEIHPIIVAQGLPFEIEPSRLWTLPAKRTSLAISEMLWMLDLPYWPAGGRLFSLSPVSVLATPGQWPVHDRKIDAADLTYPIDVIFHERRWLILDGLHRLCRATRDGGSNVDVRIHQHDAVWAGARQTALPTLCVDREFRDARRC